MDSNRIEIEYAIALGKAKELEEIASKLNTLSTSEMDTLFSGIGAAWSNSVAAKYLNKGEILQTKISNTAGELNDAAAKIRKIATDLYNADLAAAAIASD